VILVADAVLEEVGNEIPVADGAAGKGTVLDVM